MRSRLRGRRKGVQVSVRLIGRGGRIKAWVPSKAAYGPEGYPALKIAPNTTLYYEIELVDVDKYSSRRR